MLGWFCWINLSGLYLMGPVYFVGFHGQACSVGYAKSGLLSSGPELQGQVL